MNKMEKKTQYVQVLELFVKDFHDDIEVFYILSPEGANYVGWGVSMHNASKLYSKIAYNLLNYTIIAHEGKRLEMVEKTRNIFKKCKNAYEKTDKRHNRPT